MSKLAFYTKFNLQKPYKVSEEVEDFSEELFEAGVCIEKWSHLTHLPSASVSHEDIFKIYFNEINLIKSKYGYQQADYSCMTPNDAFSISVRGRNISEHIHEEDEVRFILSGRLLIYLNVNHKIHILECSRGDFVRIPAGIKHWVDIGPKPEFSVIRWYNTTKAFKNIYTNSFVAESTPRWETIYSEEHFKR